MLYSLLITLALAGSFDTRPVAVTTAVVPGFTTSQACENAKTVVLAGKPSMPSGHATVMTAVCLPNSL